jgi:hypothetical protein
MLRFRTYRTGDSTFLKVVFNLMRLNHASLLFDGLTRGIDGVGQSTVIVPSRLLRQMLLQGRY